MSYRTNFSNTKENFSYKMAESKPEDKNVIHDMTNIWYVPNMDIHKCPFCDNYYKFSLISSVIFCSPTKRFTQGFLWCKKVCCIDTYHTHHICCKCKAHWIINKPVADNPIKSVVML